MFLVDQYLLTTKFIFFSSYLLRAYQIVSTVLGAGDEAMTKQTSQQTKKN